MRCWQRVKLKDLCYKITDGTHITPKYKDNGVVFLSAKNISKGIFNPLNCKFISNEEHLELIKRCNPEHGDVLLSKSGSLGDSVVVPDVDFEFSIFESIALIKVKKEKLCPYFLKNFFSSGLSQKNFSSITTGLAVKHLHLIDLRLLKIPTPPLPEQKAIAAILTTWDRAIETSEQLIAAKEKRKQALMQQLLTGKVRFGEFVGKKWVTYRLGKLFKQRSERGRDALPLVSITMAGGVVSRDDVVKKDTSSEDKSKYLRICPGDIGYNTMRMWQGVSGVSTLEGIVSPAYTICIPSPKVSAEFISYLFKFQPMVHLFYRHSQGLVSDTWNLKFRHFSQIKVTIPSVKEQRKIASVLQAADAEIQVHREKLAALKSQKKGLMQQLLTGRVRVNGASLK